MTIKQIKDSNGTSHDIHALKATQDQNGNVINTTYATQTALTNGLATKMGDYTIEIYNGTDGNPKPVRFASFNYSTCDSENGIAAKIGLVSGHGNGSSYAFLEDAIIKVNHLGQTEVDNFKYYGQDCGAYDGTNRQYGDIFWLVDETNKIVDFYVLMGQYARVNQTPWKRLTYSSKGTVTQYTNCTVYSSGTKNWGNNDEIAVKSDIIADVNTTYSLSKSGSTITLTGSDGSTTSVTDTDTNTDTKVTAVGNHYTPTKSKTISANSTTSASWGSTDIVTGIEMDAAGHVTGVTSIQMPANPNSNTTYSFATGDSNGQFKVTPSSGSAYNVSIKGLGSAAYANTSAFQPAGNYQPAGSYMDLGSAQTASGVKTFSNGINIGSAKLTYDSTNSALVISF